METELSRQGLRLFLALLLGAGLGLGYDILRPPRRRGSRALGAVLDVLFCVFSGFAVFVYAMGAPNGRLGLWELTAVLMGFLLYMHTLSAPVLRVLTALLELFCAWAEKGKKMGGRILRLTKNALGAVRQCCGRLRRRLKGPRPPDTGEENKRCRRTSSCGSWSWR